MRVASDTLATSPAYLLLLMVFPVQIPSFVAPGPDPGCSDNHRAQYRHTLFRGVLLDPRRDLRQVRVAGPGSLRDDLSRRAVGARPSHRIDE